VIDDGSKISEHTITSFLTLFPHVAAAGFDVIEDLFFSYDGTSGGSPSRFDDPTTSPPAAPSV
jgi:hypothetical protein